MKQGDLWASLHAHGGPFARFGFPCRAFIALLFAWTPANRASEIIARKDRHSKKKNTT